MKLLVTFAALWAFAAGQMRAYEYPCHTVQGFMDVTQACHYHIEDGGHTVNDKLNNFCGPTMAAYSDCVRSKFTPCLAYQTEVDLLLAEYKGRVCDGDSLKPEVEELRHTLNCLFGDTDCDCPDTCTWDEVQIELDVCYDRWYNHELFDYTLNPTEMDWARLGLRALGKSVLRCVRNRIEMKPTPPCDAMTRDAVVYYNLAYIMAPGPDVEFADATQWTQFNDRSTITAFGDPHFKIYDPAAAKLGEYTIFTCSSMLWQNFLTTHHLKIGALNVPVGIDGEFDETSTEYDGHKLPSIMAKFKLTFYDTDGEEIATYFAFHGHFPSKLIFPKDKPETDDLVLRIDGGGTRLVIKYLSAGIVLTSYSHGRYFLVISVRMANGLIREGSGLMKDGCSAEEQIDAPPPEDGGGLNMADMEDLPDVRRRKKRATDSECREACAASFLVDQSVGDACLYDCGVTGDTEMASASNPGKAEAALAELDNEMLETSLAAAQGKSVLRLPDSGATVPTLSGLAAVALVLMTRALFA